MARFLLNKFLFFILLGCSISSFAQDGVAVKAAVDKNEILIGEPFRLSIDVKSPMVSGNQLPQFDSIPHFELIEKESRDSTVSAEGVSYHLEWKLTSFDSGTRVIPAFTITIGQRNYKTDSLAVEVSYGNVDTTKDYHDIKGIIDIENPNVKYIPWIIGAATLISLLIFIWAMRQKPARPERMVTAVSKGRTAYEEAMQSLESLREMLRKDPAEVKAYYSGMNDSLRIYLKKRVGLQTMEKTSEELIMMMSSMKMDRERFSKLTAALRMSDFVKFAKYIPGPYENDNNLEEVKKSIGLLEEELNK